MLLPKVVAFPEAVAFPEDEVEHPEEVALLEEVALAEEVVHPEEVAFPEEVAQAEEEVVLQEEVVHPEEVALAVEVVLPEEVALPEEVVHPEEADPVASRGGSSNRRRRGIKIAGFVAAATIGAVGGLLMCSGESGRRQHTYTHSQGSCPHSCNLQTFVYLLQSMMPLSQVATPGVQVR